MHNVSAIPSHVWGNVQDQADSGLADVDQTSLAKKGSGRQRHRNENVVGIAVEKCGGNEQSEFIWSTKTTFCVCTCFWFDSRYIKIAVTGQLERWQVKRAGNID